MYIAFLCQICHALDDIIDIYNRLPNVSRSRAKQDVPKVLKHVTRNLLEEADDTNVVIRCFRLLEVLAIENSSSFVHYFDNISKQARVCSILLLCSVLFQCFYIVLYLVFVFNVSKFFSDVLYFVRFVCLDPKALFVRVLIVLWHNCC